MCESVENSGQRCKNPQIKYGTVTGGECLKKIFPMNLAHGVFNSVVYMIVILLEQGLATYCVFGSNHSDESDWHWTDCVDGYILVQPKAGQLANP